MTATFVEKCDSSKQQLKNNINEGVEAILPFMGEQKLCLEVLEYVVQYAFLYGAVTILQTLDKQIVYKLMDDHPELSQFWKELLADMEDTV